MAPPSADRSDPTARTASTADPAQGRSLAGRTVLVTGGASGLGAAVVRRADEAGATTVVVDRACCDGPGHPVAVDLADTAATERAVSDAIEGLPPLAAVVTCAGVDRPAPFTALDAAAWERIVAVNLFGTAAVVRRGSWEVPRIFTELQRLGDVADDEMAAVFNLGVGMVVVVAPTDAEAAVAVAHEHGSDAVVVGEVVAGDGTASMA